LKGPRRAADAARDAARVKQAAQSFEALLLRQLAEPALRGKGNGPAADVAADAFVQALARSGGTGLADALLEGVAPVKQRPTRANERSTP
jgi:Rod binding domain-containing protein